jgi:hypothetical protein
MSACPNCGEVPLVCDGCKQTIEIPEIPQPDAPPAGEVWHLEEYREGSTTCVRIKDENGLLVADMGTRWDDARLIVQAPALRAVLAALMETWHRHATLLHNDAHRARMLLAETKGAA